MEFVVLFVKLGEDGFLSQKQKSLPKNILGLNHSSHQSQAS
jgi:hypothetical protein